MDGWTPPKGGFLSRWLDIAEKMTWLPESWKLTSGMMTLSCTVGTRVFVQPGARMFRPNLYVMLIGESGSGKGTAIHDLTEELKGIKEWCERNDIGNSTNHPGDN